MLDRFQENSSVRKSFDNGLDEFARNRSVSRSRKIDFLDEFSRIIVKWLFSRMDILGKKNVPDVELSDDDLNALGGL